MLRSISCVVYSTWLTCIVQHLRVSSCHARTIEEFPRLSAYLLLCRASELGPNPHCVNLAHAASTNASFLQLAHVEHSHVTVGSGLLTGVPALGVMSNASEVMRERTIADIMKS